MSAAPIHLGPHRMLLDAGGALFWPEQALLAVADLHLEKATHFAARGQLLPPWDTRLTLDRLAPLLRRYAPRLVVALGDSFHDGGGSARIAAADAARLGHLVDGLDLVWVLGNHDPRPPEELPGRSLAELALAGVVFRHHPGPRYPAAGADAEVFGHFHPRARVAAPGGALARPCFVADARRVLLPAFGEFTGGLDVRNAAIAGLFPRGARSFLLGRERLYSFSLAQLRGMAEPAAPLA